MRTSALSTDVSVIELITTWSTSFVSQCRHDFSPNGGFILQFRWTLLLLWSTGYCPKYSVKLSDVFTDKILPANNDEVNICLYSWDEFTKKSYTNKTNWTWNFKSTRIYWIEWPFLFLVSSPLFNIYSLFAHCLNLNLAICLQWLRALHYKPLVCIKMEWF